MCVAVAAAGVAAAGAIGGAVISSSGAQSAADTQAQAAQSASAAQVYQTNQAINEQNALTSFQAQLNNPNRISGNYAQQALEGALGLPQTSLQSLQLPTAQGNAGGGGGSSLVDTSSGIPQPNQQLYNSNPAYKQAWDQVDQANQARFGRGYGGNSNVGMLTTELQNALGTSGMQSIQNQVTTQNTLAGNQQLSPSQTSQFGGLFKPFSYTADQYQQSPGYQFTLGQGLQAINNQASATGLSQSPNTQKALASYAEGLANQDYQQAYSNAYQAYTQNQANTLNTLGSAAGWGNTATANIGSAAGNAGTNISNLQSSLGSALGSNIIGGGNATAAGQVGVGNAITGGLGNLTNTLTQGINTYLTPQSGTGYGFSMPGSSSGGGYNFSNPSYGLGSGLNYNQG